MDKFDTQRLSEINSQLLKLYLQLNQNPSDEVRSEITKLEMKKDGLSDSVLYDVKTQQYVTILRSAASSLQLQRQTLHDFAHKPISQLRPDEVRQKNIAFNKLKSIEKKIESYHKKLTEMGLKSVEVDAILLEGYREQSERFLQNSLRVLESTIKDYLIEFYQDNNQLPENLLESIESWETTHNRQELTYSQLRILDIKSQCLLKGISQSEILSSIQSVSSWNEEKKEHQLQTLKIKLQQEIESSNMQVDITDLVDEWIQRYSTDKRLEPQQVAIVNLIQELQIYGVLQHEISRVLQSVSPQNRGVLSLLTNRFRRKS